MADHDIVVNDTVVIPGNEVSFRFSRSGGSGGQNVNKVNSRAELIWNAQESEVLSPPALRRLLHLGKRYVVGEGELHIASQSHREQLRNIETCKERLRDLVAKALIAPRKRKKTRPTKGSKLRRLRAKKQRSETKKGRKYRAGKDD